MAQREYNKLFVGGDLSGIQKFLYNITSRKAAVSLKGRSATLSEDMREIYYAKTKDAIIKAGGVIREEDELYCSGGKFFLIASYGGENYQKICDSIDKCQKECREQIWKEHRGQLGINICYVAFNEENDIVNVEGKYGEPPFEGKEKGPGQLWKVVSAGFAQQKNQRFKEYILKNYNDFFGKGSELIMSSERKVCAVTGIEFDVKGLKEEDYTIPAKDEDDEAIIVLPSVKRQIEKGEQLRNDPQKGFKTFEAYATTDDGLQKQVKGNTYLAVLRMDVDGLGKRFIKGFNSLDEYKNFSKRLVEFFEKSIENDLLPEHVDKFLSLTEEQKKTYKKKNYKKFMNIIYAGGDDLFIIGRWDKVIDFAKFIHQETIAHFPTEGISISGGIAMVKPKYPIAKAAEMAGEAEDAAKQGEKNAFNMFGRTISWDKKKPFMGGKYEHEYDYVSYYKDKFVEYISKYNKDYGFSKSILHKIMHYSEIADMNIERESKGKAKNYSYMWHISYYMTRFMDKFKNYDNDNAKKTLYDFCHSLRDDHLLKNNGRNLQLLAVAARWAELLLKDQDNNNQ